MEINASNFRNWLDKELQDVLAVRLGKMRLSTRGEIKSGVDTAGTKLTSHFVPNKTTIKKPTFGNLLVADNVSVKCPICLKIGHLADTCRTFLREAVKSRIRLVRDKKLCYRCLKVGHIASGCPDPKKCSCGKDHHFRLHRDVEGKVLNVQAFITTEIEVFETDGEGSASESEDSEENASQVEETQQD
ncbi:DUF1759 and Peptidase A17 and DUF1758 and RVT 1 d omain containing [Paramuricea clavata]|uniref:DUF1759 and Peptidase A17 and DUF1758 and RVT 1 d omain containing n=1 Tax=Paramuricea clavata TaxID=317549 RepID=A0A6S7LVC9_PARCT|nr:DUF1759 and Peptidase A17 and DUF1758 and RVT 1 d omain containing [Paramuricea clavata]